MNYSRYADDMTFSSNKHIDIEYLKKMVATVVEDEGFRINQDKTRVLRNIKGK